jgi:hypothetical protein
MPTRNEEGLAELWDRIPSKPWPVSLIAYAASILNAAQNWMDNRQMTVPGYRDRIVHIRLDDKEGGLNLDMDPCTVKTLTTRGAEASRLLKDHFAEPTPDVALTWDNHRWIRLRSLAGQLDTLLRSMRKGLQSPEAGELSYFELLARDGETPPNSYRIGPSQQKVIRDCLDTLTKLAAEIEQQDDKARPSHKAPRPLPDLRLLARIVPNADADRGTSPPYNPESEGRLSLEPAE